MLKGVDVKEIYEMKGAGCSIRGIADGLGIARNTVRRYLNTPEAMRSKPRPLRGSKLDPYMEHIDRRMAEGLENCRVLQRELRGLVRGELHDTGGIYASSEAKTSAQGNSAF